MESTFKVGDRVRIKRRAGKASDYRFSFLDEMACLEEQIFTIKEIWEYKGSPANIKDDGYKYKLLGDSYGFSWASSMLEKVSDSTLVCTSESIIDFTHKKKHYQFNFSL